MNLKDSVIVTTTLTRIYPLVVLFSLYLMSYAAAFPGGGFQGGVIVGTMIVITEAVLEKRLHPDAFYRGVEWLGVCILLFLLVSGWMISGHPFGGWYGWSTSSLAPGNMMIWLLGCAIYLEVSGSMVLIFRRFLFWETAPCREPARAERSLHNAAATANGLKIATALTLVALGAAIYWLVPPLQLVFHTEVDAFRQLTLDFGIRNMVTTVYLGPRLMDTLLEVFVVLLAVLGLQTMGDSN